MNYTVFKFFIAYVCGWTCEQAQDVGDRKIESEKRIQISTAGGSFNFVHIAMNTTLPMLFNKTLVIHLDRGLETKIRRL